MLELARDDSAWDREVDERQVAMAREGDCVIGSRLAIWLLPKDASLSVYLHACPETRARRIWTREGGKYEDVLAFTQSRDAQDTERYGELYGIDNNRYDFADLSINTEHLDPDRIAFIIEAAARGLRSARP
ncbi:MAG: cytidylate kinase family protein [Bacillus subtilis]|nr:cytidylate kinase family protein [Bacillus subtilis]